jgi:hypothetical protein
VSQRRTARPVRRARAEARAGRGRRPRRLARPTRGSVANGGARPTAPEVPLPNQADRERCWQRNCRRSERSPKSGSCSRSTWPGSRFARRAVRRQVVSATHELGIDDVVVADIGAEVERRIGCAAAAVHLPGGRSRRALPDSRYASAEPSCATPENLGNASHYCPCETRFWGGRAGAAPPLPRRGGDVR